MVLVLDRAWRREFVGDYHIFLRDQINALKTTGHYSRFNVIIQSSGTGKSRTVDEMAKIVFTLPFNMRSDAENRGSVHLFRDWL